MRIYPWTGEFESFTGDLFVPHTESGSIYFTASEN